MMATGPGFPRRCGHWGQVRLASETTNHVGPFSCPTPVANVVVPRASWPWSPSASFPWPWRRWCGEWNANETILNEMDVLCVKTNKNGNRRTWSGPRWEQVFVSASDAGGRVDG